MKQALYYIKLDKKKVQCKLCIFTISVEIDIKIVLSTQVVLTDRYIDFYKPPSDLFDRFVIISVE